MTVRLLASGVALLLAAAASWAGLAASHLDGYRWDEASLVPADGRPHDVRLADDRTAVLWTYEPDVTPDCSAVDTTTGRALPMAPLDASYHREGGSPGDWTGTASFEPASATVEMTCRVSGGSTVHETAVAVETAPRMPAPLVGLGAWGAVPVGLALAGLLALGAAALLVVRGRPAAR